MKQLALFIVVFSMITGSIYYFTKRSFYEEYALEVKSDKVFSYKVNVNLANEREFINLPGVGPSLAHSIIDYRITHGRFNSIEDLMKVKGIGAKKFSGIKEFLTMEVY